MAHASYMVERFIRKRGIIGILLFPYQQRFLIGEKAKLKRVKRCVKRILKA